MKIWWRVAFRKITAPIRRIKWSRFLQRNIKPHDVIWEKHQEIHGKYIIADRADRREEAANLLAQEKTLSWVLGLYKDVK